MIILCIHVVIVIISINHYCTTLILYVYVTHTSTIIIILLFKLLCKFCTYFSLAFRQRATGPSSVCEGSDVTLQCVIVLNNPDNTTTVQFSVWSRAPDGTPANLLPNHGVLFNSTTGGFTDLVITNATLEDNTVYTCSSTGATITSSIVLNVTGNNMHTHVNIHNYVCM